MVWRLYPEKYQCYFNILSNLRSWITVEHLVIMSPTPFKGDMHPLRFGRQRTAVNL